MKKSIEKPIHRRKLLDIFYYHCKSLIFQITILTLNSLSLKYYIKSRKKNYVATKKKSNDSNMASRKGLWRKHDKIIVLESEYIQKKYQEREKKPLKLY